MAVDVQYYTINSVAPTLIAHATFNPMHVKVHNHEHSQNNDVYIGGSAVTTLLGFHIPSTETEQFTIGAGDIMYAICASGSAVVQVFRATL